MKKFLLSCIAVLICSTAVSKAQIGAGDYKIFNFGVKAGVNVSSVTGLSDIVGAMKSGFTGGAFFELRPIKLIGVSVEALYSDQGFNAQSSVNNWTLTTQLGYFDFPIMAKVYIAGGLAINAGIMPSFLVSSNVSIDKDKDLFNFNKSAFAIPIGLSYQFNFGLCLDARYKIGLTDVNSRTEIGTSNHNAFLDIKNESFCFMVGWRF